MLSMFLSVRGQRFAFYDSFRLDISPVVIGWMRANRFLPILLRNQRFDFSL